MTNKTTRTNCVFSVRYGLLSKNQRSINNNQTQLNLDLLLRREGNVQG